MFEEFMGLPMHALVVHAAVVLVPLLALVSLGYAVLPKARGKLAWAAVGLAIAAPIAAVVARYSGEALIERFGYPLEGLIGDHASYGSLTMWAALALGVLTLALVRVTRRGGARWLAVLLTVLVVAAAAAATVLVVLAGDAGARSVWEPRWQ